MLESFLTLFAMRCGWVLLGVVLLMVVGAIFFLYKQISKQISGRKEDVPVSNSPIAETASKTDPVQVLAGVYEIGKKYKIDDTFLIIDTSTQKVITVGKEYILLWSLLHKLFHPEQDLLDIGMLRPTDHYVGTNNEHLTKKYEDDNADHI